MSQWSRDTAWPRWRAAWVVALTSALASFSVGAERTAAPITPGSAPRPQTTPAPLALRVAKVVALDDRDTVINNAVVLVRDGRIVELGPASKVTVPDGCRVLDFPEHWLIPGLVEAHNHQASGGWGDLNDMVYQANPGLDTRSVPQPDAYWNETSRWGGVTTAIMIPGSGTNISGFGTLVNIGGHTPDEMILRAPGSLKIAQAGNPEWYFGGNGRMFMNWNTRQTLTKARDYNAAWERAESDPNAPRPAFDPIWHTFRDLFQLKIPVTVHTQIYQVVHATVFMVHGEFGLRTILDHSEFDGWKLGPIVKDLDIWTVCGPRNYHYDSLGRRFIGYTAAYWAHGVRRIGINTDSPVLPQNQLSTQAAINCWFGFLPYPALKAVTAVPAQALGAYDERGSVENGKIADLTIWTGDPLDPRSACVLTMTGGEIVYDASQGVRRF